MAVAPGAARNLRGWCACAMLGVAALATALCVPALGASGEEHAPFPVVSRLPAGLPQPTDRLPASPELIALGAYLFQSRLLSADRSVACSDCHVPDLGLSGRTPLAVGLAGFSSGRHAPPIFNLYMSTSFMWDGRAADLDHQIPMPLESREMGVEWPASIAALKADASAARLSNAAGVPSFSKSAIVNALSAFVMSLVSGGSRFDRFYYDHEAGALSEREQRGLRLFVRKAQCVTCHLLDGHAAPLTDGGFHSTGIGFIAGKYADHGRYQMTKRPQDDGLFKTPTLRNVALRSAFMHDGSMASLREVVEYYNRGCNPEAPNIDPRLHQLFMSKAEIEDLIAFLQTLSADVVSFQQSLRRAAP